jgi:hypothetical protein
MKKGNNNVKVKFMAIAVVLAPILSLVLLLSSEYVSLIVQRFCQCSLIKIGSEFPSPGMI